MNNIRRYRPADRDALYDVCLRTGADGSDASDRYLNPTLLGEVFVGPYLELPGTLAWTAEFEGVASGYILCALDTAAFEAECEAAWWPRLRERYQLNSQQAGSSDDEIVRMIHHPSLADPVIAREYPAHLHIDLLPVLQGHGAGAQLIRTLLSELRARHSSGVHLGVSTANTRAIGFYHHLGFHVITETEPSAHTTFMGMHLSHDD